MKTLLIPALALTLASLPAHAQKTAEPAAPTPLPVERPPGAPATSLGLLRKVQFDDAALGEIITYLNVKLAEQKGEPLNVVISAGLESTKVPTILLQNVTATDVLKVVAKMIDLTVEPVPSDSGKVAAWIITKGRPVNAVRSLNVALDNRSLGGGGGEKDMDFQYTYRVPRTDSAPGLPPAIRALSGQADAPAPLAEWFYAAGPAPAPAQVSRVVGIGKIYEDSFTPEERTRLEFDLADRLSAISKDQKMECQVKFYESLRVIVLKGTPEGVALIEQTVAAMKENAGGKKPAAVTAPPKF